MRSLATSARLSFSLACMVLSILCVARSLGVLPDLNEAVLDGRKSLCEAVAVGCSLAVQRGDIPALEATLRALTERNPQVLSAAVRHGDGETLAVTGDHAKHWGTPATKGSTPTHVRVPIILGDAAGGTSRSGSRRWPGGGGWRCSGTRSCGSWPSPRWRCSWPSRFTSGWSFGRKAMGCRRTSRPGQGDA